MTPDEQQTRTETGAVPAGAPAVAAPGGAEIGLSIPEDALILVTTRNLVLFPGTVLPMTLGRQRSVLAAQTAVRLSRPVGLVLQREAELDAPMPADLHPVGTEANLLRYVTSPGRQSSCDLPGRAALPHHRIPRRLSVFCRARDPGPRVGGAEHRDRRPDAASAQPGARSAAIAAADPGRAGQRGAGRRVGAGAGRSDRQLHGHHARRKAGNSRDLRYPASPGAGLGTAFLPARSAAPVAPDPRPHQGDDGRAAARVPAARTAEDDPEGAGRGRGRQGPGDRRIAPQGGRSGNARGGRGAREAGAGPARTHAGTGRRIFDGPHLCRMADRTALEGRGRGADRHRRGAPRARRGPLRAAEDQAPHPRISRDPQAEPERPQPDPVLCRAAGGGEDLARTEHRARHGEKVRPGQPRRHA